MWRREPLLGRGRPVGGAAPSDAQQEEEDAEAQAASACRSRGGTGRATRWGSARLARPCSATFAASAGRRAATMTTHRVGDDASGLDHARDGATGHAAHALTRKP